MAFFVAGVLSAADKSPEQYISDLKGGSEEAQVEACKGLGRAKAKQAVPDLITALGSKSTLIQSSAAAALGAIGEKGDSTTAVLKLATDTKDPVVRYSALASLMSLVEDEKKAEIKDAMNAQAENPDDLLSDLATKLAAKLEK